MRRAVKVISSPKAVRLLADPTRRQVLALIAAKPMTEKQLAEALQLTKASMSYHLHLLLGARLIRVARTEVEIHGILQKYYEPEAPALP